MKKIFLVLLVVAFGIVTFGCGGNSKSKLEKVANDVEIPAEINSSILLPTSVELNHINVSWESSNENVIDNTGRVFMPEVSTDVVLTATFSDIDGNVHTKEYNSTVVVDKKDKFTLAYSMYEGTIKSTYTKNAVFKIVKYSTYEASFESSDLSAMSHTGQIYQKDVDQNIYVKMTITNTATNESRIYYKRVTVLKYTNQAFMEIISAWAKEKLDMCLNGTLDRLPTEHEKYPSKIVWLGGTRILMTSEGKIVRPVEYVDDVIKVRITYADSTNTYEFKVKNIGGNTEEAFLNSYLEYIMPSEVTAHHSYLYKQYGEDNDYFLHHQVKINKGGVLNLINGQPLTINKSYYIDVEKETGLKKAWSNSHPALPETLGTNPVGKANISDLDAFYNHFGAYYGWKMNATDEEKLAAYQSYEVPNEDNILWIVVHESGMPGVGNDAALLAKIQREQAEGKRTYREASWNYQVDEGAIYQSFADTVYCWHAGGDYGKHLPLKNSNSIGIEMCINRDGNYDGSMRHDAKLVANLMYNHNLGFENVIRHYDTAGKECPSYMLRTDRYNEFLGYVTQEYYAIEYLRDATVIWTVSDLEALFTKGGNGLYYAKGVDAPKNITIKLEVTKGDYHFEKEVTVTLQPDTINTEIWEWSE